MTRDFDALIEYLDARAATPFVWGSRANDCVSFAAGGVGAQTGDDVIGRCGHSWTTAIGAARVLRRIGGVAAAADLMLEPLRAPALAHRGDVGFVLIGGRESLVLFEGDLLVGPGPAGSVRLPRRLAIRAWTAG